MSALAPVPALHPLLEQLVSRHRFSPVTPENLDEFGSAPGLTMLIFTEDPVRYRETLDLAVIGPEIIKAFPEFARVGVLYPEEARKAAPRFGFARWPALVVLRDGAYVGAIDGLRDWDVYLEETARLVASQPSRPPSVGIAVKSAGAQAPGCGH
jgi:hydrogenase-1 operon protein HyaE